MARGHGVAAARNPRRPNLRSRCAVAALVLLLAPVQSQAVARTGKRETDLTLRIAKNQAAIKPFGSLTPGDRGGSVRLRLFKLSDGKPTLRESTRVELGEPRDRDDDGVPESPFSGALSRPDEGQCRVVVVYPGDARRARARVEQDLPCYIPDFAQGTARLTPALGDDTVVDALIADDDVERGYGLMYRKRLRADLGMAFQWPSDISGGFWMKNTLIPLSIAFFDSNGTILKIMDMAPCTKDPCRSYGPGVSYRGAFEVNKGAFDDWGITEGDSIEITE